MYILKVGNDNYIWATVSIFKNREGFLENASRINTKELQVIIPPRFSVFRPCVNKMFTIMKQQQKADCVGITLRKGLSACSASGQTELHPKTSLPTSYNSSFNIEVSAVVMLGL